ncbi:hypothetical protein [Candidatus Methylacidithermus pantelleriae]|uniref:Uncharacterized protein n=1 Tax=Candidatus Methylacidithermus pantelleriae TaxID=2744239 RepID=A0A8J2BNF3_9BACT|nr:hypothetical protein [Candidatus Methylacidithermus pantelleriae]CAF0696014.1 hypothetical protein MPNT_20087 [Candidatus Methylacidithermus pantelleriae]
MKLALVRGATAVGRDKEGALVPTAIEACARCQLKQLKRKYFSWVFYVRKFAFRKAMIDLGAAVRAGLSLSAVVRIPGFKGSDCAIVFCVANRAGSFRAAGHWLSADARRGPIHECA